MKEKIHNNPYIFETHTITFDKILENISVFSCNEEPSFVTPTNIF